MRYRNKNFVMIRSLRSMMTSELMTKLENLHIHTLEDLIAVWEIEGLGDLLSDNLEMSRENLDKLVDNLAAKPRILHHSLTLLDPVKESSWKQWHFGLQHDAEERGELLQAQDTEPEPQEKFRIPKDLQLASKASLIPGLRPVKDQGQRGTCVAFGTNAVREYLLGGEDGSRLSEQFLYWGIKMRDGRPDGSGSRIRYAVQCLVEAGVCEEETWQYNPQRGDSEHQGPPSAGAEKEAKKYIISKGISLTDDPVKAIKAVLSGWNGFPARPVSFGIPVYDSWRRNPITYRTGRIPMPLPGENHVGGHCMTLVGFQDDSSWPGDGYFIFRNSWGTGWASECEFGGGYGTIPYAYISDDLWGAWTLETERVEKEPMKTSFFTWKTVAAGILIGLAVVAGFMMKSDSPSALPNEEKLISEEAAPPMVTAQGEAPAENSPVTTSIEPAGHEQVVADQADMEGQNTPIGLQSTKRYMQSLDGDYGPEKIRASKESNPAWGQGLSLRTSEEDAWRSLLEQTPTPELLATYPYHECFERKAEANGIPVALALGVARQLSNFDSGRSMGNGAGIMNVNKDVFAKPEDALDPCGNIAEGCKLLAKLMHESEGNVVPAISAYRRQFVRLHTELLDKTDAAFSMQLREVVSEVLTEPYQENTLTPFYAFEERMIAEENLIEWEKRSGQDLWMGQKGKWFVLYLENDVDGQKMAAMNSATGLSPYLPWK